MSLPRKERIARARSALLEQLKTLSYRRGEVVLASGKRSDFFIDCKQTSLTATGHLFVGELLLDALREFPDCEAVAGVALGGCPLASAVSLTSALQDRPLPALLVRKASKDHGTRQQIEGPWKPGMSVVMVEDVITTGGSTLRAVKALAAEGLRVIGVAVLVDRLEGGVEALAAEGLSVVSLYTRHDFLEADPMSSTVALEALDGRATTS